MVFFRYEHVRGQAFGGRFDRLAIPPAMTWRDPLRPNPPRHLRGENGQLCWDAPVAAADGDVASWYAVYRRLGAGGDGELLAVLPATRLSWPERADMRATAAIGDADGYAVTALDAFWNESAAAGTAPAIAAAEPQPSMPAPSIPVSGPRISVPVDAGHGTILLGYELGEPAFVRLRLMDANGAEALVLVDGWQEAGTHVLGLVAAQLPDDVSRYIFEAGDLRSIMDFTVE